MSAQPCDEPTQNLHYSKQYVPYPLVDNFLITHSKSDGYSCPLVVWCVATRRREQCAKHWKNSTTEAGQKILSEMSDAQQTVDHITALENFVLGFRLGARIMLECMDSGDGDTKEMIEHG